MNFFQDDAEKRLKWKFANFCEKKGKLETALKLYKELVKDIENHDSTTDHSIQDPNDHNNNSSEVGESIESCQDQQQHPNLYRLYFNVAQVTTTLFKKQQKMVSNKSIVTEQYQQFETTTHTITSNEVTDRIITISDIISFYQKALLLNPMLMEVYVNLSGLLITQRLSEEAISWSLQGISCLGKYYKDDTSSSYREHQFSLYTNLNIALRQVGRIEQAIELTWTAMNLKPPRNLLLLEEDVDVVQRNNNHVQNNHERKESNNKNDNHKIFRFDFVCVKYGTKYSATYVNHLYRMITEKWYLCQCDDYSLGDESFPLPHFICYTEDGNGLHPDIEIRNFSEGAQEWQSWWRKAQIFQSSQEFTVDTTKWTVYLDLDTIILQSMQYLLFKIIENCDYTTDDYDRFFTLDASTFHNEGRPRGINSSIMIWRQNTFSHLYDFLCTHYEQITNFIFKWDHYLEMMLLDTTITTTCAALRVSYLQDILSRPFIVDYTQYCRLRENKELAKCCVVCFPLFPKPHDLIFLDIDMWSVWEGISPLHSELKGFCEEVD